MPTIQISPATYDGLARRAAIARTTVDELIAPTLQALASEEEATASVPPKLSTAEFRRLLDAMAIDMPGVPPLPDDFSRADMYHDHD